MHASNLLKAVLKPRPITSSSSGQALSSKDAKSSRATRASSPDSGRTASVSVTNKKSSPSPAPVKMSCLCAPTNHAGSFRCRLHRGNQQSWGGRPLAPATTTSTGSKPSTTASGKVPSTAPVAAENRIAKRVLHPVPNPRQPMTSFSPPGRSSDARPSRLSKVSAASDAEAQDHAAVPTPASNSGNGTVRYLKFSSGGGATNGAVLEGGMGFIKKLQTGGKDVMHEVFGSGTGLSRAGLTL